jgi:hypothetical protein
MSVNNNTYNITDDLQNYDFPSKQFTINLSGE